MDEYNKYAALADTIKIVDITSDRRKQSILQRLKDNDESFNKLWICNRDQVLDNNHDYDPNTSAELAWLGYFLGQSTNVNELHIRYSPESYNSGIEVFRRGMGYNTSIWKITIGAVEGSILPMMAPFFINNHNLNEIAVEGCEFGAEGARQLSLTLGGCSKSLKIFRIRESDLQDGNVVDIITALSMHPQLTELRLSNVHMGRNECMALATLLRRTTTKLEDLLISSNDIDDEGVEVLVHTLASHNKIKGLNLSSNQTITITGWAAVATLLESPGCNLEKLDVSFNNFGDEGALLFAKALANNSILKSLDLRACRFSHRGFAAPFSKLLCDTSSVNNTYLSNHTLTNVGNDNGVFGNVLDSLGINRSRLNKGQVAMSKILQHHSHFDLEPLFEWEFKALPIMIEWFTNAASRVATTYALFTNEYKRKIRKMKLSTVYDFIKEFPMLYIEPMTRQEVTEYTAMEEELQQGNENGDMQEVRLGEIRRCKARAMRRL